MDILLATQIICVLGDMTLQSRPSKRLHMEILDFDTVALKFGLDPFPTQFDPLNKNMKSDFRKMKRIFFLDIAKQVSGNFRSTFLRTFWVKFNRLLVQ